VPIGDVDVVVLQQGFTVPRNRVAKWPDIGRHKAAMRGCSGEFSFLKRSNEPNGVA